MWHGALESGLHEPPLVVMVVVGRVSVFVLIDIKRRTIAKGGQPVERKEHKIENTEDDCPSECETLESGIIDIPIIVHEVV